MIFLSYILSMQMASRVILWTKNGTNAMKIFFKWCSTAAENRIPTTKAPVSIGLVVILMRCRHMEVLIMTAEESAVTILQNYR